jgi:hypothetical protein
MIHFPVPTIIWCKSGDRIKNTEHQSSVGGLPRHRRGAACGAREQPTTNLRPLVTVQFNFQKSFVSISRCAPGGIWASQATRPPNVAPSYMALLKHKVRARQSAQTAGHFRAKVCEPCHARPMIPRLTVRLFSDIHGDPVGRTVSPYLDCRGAWLLLFGTLKGTSLGR